MVNRLVSGGNAHHEPSSCREKISSSVSAEHAASTRTHLHCLHRMYLDRVTRACACDPAPNHFSTTDRKEPSRELIAHLHAPLTDSEMPKHCGFRNVVALSGYVGEKKRPMPAKGSRSHTRASKMHVIPQTFRRSTPRFAAATRDLPFRPIADCAAWRLVSRD